MFDVVTYTIPGAKRHSQADENANSADFSLLSAEKTEAFHRL